MIWWLVFTAVNLLVIVNNMSVPTLSKPTFMESGIHTIFVNTLTSSGTGITITFGSPFAVGTMPKAAVSLCSFQLTPTSTVDWHVGIVSKSNSNLLLSWASNAIETMKFTYIVSDPPSIQYHIYQAFISNAEILTSSPEFTTTGQVRTMSHTSAASFTDYQKMFVNIFINGFILTTTGTEFNLNITHTGSAGGSLKFDMSFGSETLVLRLDFSYMAWIITPLMDSLYSYQNIIAFKNGEDMIGSLDTSNHINQAISIGWSCLSMTNGNAFTFNLQLDQANNYYPNQLTDVVPYNQFNILAISSMTCSSGTYDSLSKKCGTAQQIHGCITFQHTTVLPNNFKNIHVSKSGKYIAGTGIDEILEVYIYAYDVVKGTYDLLQELTTLAKAFQIQFSSNWTYLATIQQSFIMIYGMNGTYKPIQKIQAPQTVFQENFCMSADATMIIAQTTNYLYFFQFNFTTMQYQIISKIYKDPADKLEISVTADGSMAFIAYHNSVKNLLIVNPMSQLSTAISDNIEHTFHGMDFNADTTILATFNSDSIIVYNIDLATKSRTVHQIITFEFYEQEKQTDTSIKLSGNGLKIVYLSSRHYYQIVLVYERSNVEDKFIVTEHIKLPTDSLGDVEVSEDGQIVIVPYRQKIMLYYCEMTINKEQIIPEITFNISKFNVKVEKVQKTEEPPETTQFNESNKTTSDSGPILLTTELILSITATGLILVNLIGIVVTFVCLKNRGQGDNGQNQVNDLNFITNESNSAFLSEKKDNTSKISEKPNDISKTSEKSSIENDIKQQPRFTKAYRNRKRKRDNIDIVESATIEHIEPLSISQLNQK